ncbi:MAG: hypothetical protein BTN85_1173 [Candidatus Methanohalarchaeum thermophilum]|uniref:Uncharacterized protein n=1 Tax=Methanohalarchaeum thermophilum TaxID=1903181 RepID=A0A1Q6DWF4_METT1|nr:MAG: hypothetical protein BTN85_1173 [Candidatus Methanohalarchaeum thermophilum]
MGEKLGFKRLKELLNEAYGIESYLENSKTWEASLNTEKFKEKLIQISEESFQHRERLIELSNMLGIDIKKEFPEADQMKDRTIYEKLVNTETLARDTYTELHKIEEDIIEEHWLEEDPKQYYRKIENLISEEKGHLNILRGIIRDQETAQKELDIEKTKVKEALEKIKGSEDRLKESTIFGAKETLLLAFTDLEDLNKVNRKLAEKENTKIQEVTKFPDKTLIEVLIESPTTSYL